MIQGVIKMQPQNLICLVSHSKSKSLCQQYYIFQKNLISHFLGFIPNKVGNIPNHIVGRSIVLCFVWYQSFVFSTCVCRDTSISPLLGWLGRVIWGGVGLDRLSKECLILSCLPKPSFADMACPVSDVLATYLWSCQ